MLVDAAMCFTQNEEIIQKIKQKYNFDSLISVLKINDESFDFLEKIVRLLRSCYFNPNIQFDAVNDSKIEVMEQYIYMQLEKITDFSNKGQIKFTTESIMLLSNCFNKISNIGDKLQKIIGSLLVGLLQNYDVFIIPNAIDFASGDVETFIDFNFISNHNKIVNEDIHEGNVDLKNNQKKLVAAILILISKFKFKGYIFKETLFKSNQFAYLDFSDQTIEKWIILHILKFAYISNCWERTGNIIKIYIVYRILRKLF